MMDVHTASQLNNAETRMLQLLVVIMEISSLIAHEWYSRNPPIRNSVSEIKLGSFLYSNKGTNLGRAVSYRATKEQS